MICFRPLCIFVFPFSGNCGLFGSVSVKRSYICPVFRHLLQISGINHHLEHPRWVFLFLFYVSWLRGCRLLKAEWTWTNQALPMVSYGIHAWFLTLPTPQICSDQHCFAHRTGTWKISMFCQHPGKRNIILTRSPSEFPLQNGWGLMNWNFHSLLGSEEWGRPYHFVDNTVGSGVHLSQSHFFKTLVRQCCPQNAFHQAILLQIDWYGRPKCCLQNGRAHQLSLPASFCGT